MSEEKLSSVSNAFIKRQKTQLGAAIQLHPEEVLKNYAEILSTLELVLKNHFFSLVRARLSPSSVCLANSLNA